jgi:hypothetical protein
MEETGISFDKPWDRLPCHANPKGWLLDWIGKSKANIVSLVMMLVYNSWLAQNDA